MLNELFVLGLTLVFFGYLLWGFRVLPGAHWQILATLPRRPAANGEWLGLNLTYYGLFSSLAQIVSVMTVFLLFGSVGITRAETVLLTIVVMGVCVPGSKLVAMLVEKKSATFSVSGAAFIGVLIAPWAIHLSNVTVGAWIGSQVPVLPALSAIGIAYGFGEGLGRLACISFGCCYGKPLRESPPLVRRLFQHWHFVFHGETKKIAYAGRLEGEKVVPIQALTAVLYTGAGLAGMLLFLRGAYAPALFVVLGVAQSWRAFSETLRADWRGAGRFSAYQWMSLASLPYALAVVLLLPAQPLPAVSLSLGLDALWHPGLVLFLGALWLTTFLYYGRSLVTGSRLSLFVCHDRI
jgi:prolipoprotein diacylglyceryltransferase